MPLSTPEKMPETEPQAHSLKPNPRLTPEESHTLCQGCGMCCRYITTEIPVPASWKQIERIKWYLLHNTFVFISEDEKWNLEIPIPCSAQNERGECTIYENRPDVCKEYLQDECERYGEGEYYTCIFRNADDFLAYVKGHPELSKLIAPASVQWNELVKKPKATTTQAPS